ncbi:valine--tRNA ligase [Striga asiatica]|uniref:Valine--tRNA ligase n=1 Tax=Striga asiatica TaxID=4170 RepID=A0A5A7PRJ0_STRAF|nr:valine--tRNA ligase [Striga asiatica]
MHFSAQLNEYQIHHTSEWRIENARDAPLDREKKWRKTSDIETDRRLSRLVSWRTAHFTLQLKLTRDGRTENLGRREKGITEPRRPVLLCTVAGTAVVVISRAGQNQSSQIIVQNPSPNQHICCSLVAHRSSSASSHLQHAGLAVPASSPPAPSFRQPASCSAAAVRDRDSGNS